VRYAALILWIAALLCGTALPQTQNQTNLSPDQIIKKFAEKEGEFYDAWMEYAYIQTAEIRVLSVNDVPQKEKMTIVWEVVFKDDGSREVKFKNETGRLRSMQFTEEDRDVISNINPFALTTKDLPLYNVKYEGKEKIDELNCHVFSVSPKSIAGKRFYFQGKIWVDDQDLQVVRTVGRAVPQTKERQFPEFETIRQMVDKKYWFPTWTHADSLLSFPDGKWHIEETITYEDYKRFRTTVRMSIPSDPQDAK
jgi:outer membrane lipoprotein-sorting protein